MLKYAQRIICDAMDEMPEATAALEGYFLYCKETKKSYTCDGLAWVEEMDENNMPVGGGASDWPDITNKPETFTPSVHSHAIADVTNLQATLNGKSASDHNHNLNDLSEKSYNSLSNKPDLTSLHSHINKALLDTYTQLETDIADAVSKKHLHGNLALLDTYTQTEANLADAIAKKHSHANSAALNNVSGTNTGDQTISDATISTSDITTNNATAAKHGFLPKLSGVNTEFLRGDGVFATPAGGSDSAPRMMNPVSWMGAANLTTASALVTNVSYFLYLGRIGKALSTIDIVNVVAAAAAVITWAEVGIFKGTLVANGAATGLTRLGFTNVAATFNSTGIKKTSVALTGHAANDDLWVAFGSQATTPYQIRSGLAYHIQDGGFQQIAGRISTLAASNGVNVAATLAIPWCQAIFV